MDGKHGWLAWLGGECMFALLCLFGGMACVFANCRLFREWDGGRAGVGMCVCVCACDRV